MEYATTCGRASRVAAPIPPEGEGWVMAGAAANETMLFWFWQRAVDAGSTSTENDVTHDDLRTIEIALINAYDYFRVHGEGSTHIDQIRECECALEIVRRIDIVK